MTQHLTYNANILLYFTENISTTKNESEPLLATTPTERKKTQITKSVTVTGMKKFIYKKKMEQITNHKYIADEVSTLCVHGKVSETTPIRHSARLEENAKYESIVKNSAKQEAKKIPVIIPYQSIYVLNYTKPIYFYYYYCIAFKNIKKNTSYIHVFLKSIIMQQQNCIFHRRKQSCRKKQTKR